MIEVGIAMQAMRVALKFLKNKNTITRVRKSPKPYQKSLEKGACGYLSFYHKAY